MEANMDQSHPKEGSYEQHQQFWSQHRTTLISFETQYVHATRAESTNSQEQVKRPKGKKKNIQYQGGFLFPGRPGDKEENIPQLILNSKYNNLKDLFEERANTPKEMLKLRQFVKIMLQLKHNSILQQFFKIYDMIIRQIKDVKFESIRLEKDRFTIIQQIGTKVTGFVHNCAYLFSFFSKHIKENKKETTHLFKVTAYCFLAQKYKFNINQFYAQAFDCQQQEGKIPKKKRKLEQKQE